MILKNNYNIDQRNLSILVSPYGLSFNIYKSNNEKKFFEYQFDKGNPYKIETELKKILLERPVLKNKFNKVDIIHHNNLNTLVPNQLFNDKNPSIYLKYNITLLDTDKATYDKISHMDVINVYLPFGNINNVFMDYNKSINYFHSSTVFIERINKLRIKHPILNLYEVYLNVYTNDFQLLIYKNEEIIFLNSFEYKTTDDFLYFFFFVLDSLDIEKKEIKYYICGVNNDFEILKDLRDFVPDWQIIPARNKSKINNFIL